MENYLWGSHVCVQNHVCVQLFCVQRAGTQLAALPFHWQVVVHSQEYVSRLLNSSDPAPQIFRHDEPACEPLLQSQETLSASSSEFMGGSPSQVSSTTLHGMFFSSLISQFRVPNGINVHRLKDTLAL